MTCRAARGVSAGRRGGALTLDATDVTAVVNSVGVADDSANALAEVNVAQPANPGVATDEIDFVANAPLDASTVSAADFTADTANVTITGVAVVDDTITVTMSGNFEAGDTVTLKAGSIANSFGGDGPAAAVTSVAAAA